MTFIGMRAVKCLEDGSCGPWQKATVKHFNPEFIKIVDEKTMNIIMDDGTVYRIDEESLQIFLSSTYGENMLRGDKLDDGDNNGYGNINK